jgi:hypothetical protein
MCFIAPGGRVVASVSDFDRSGYGGFSLAEGQRHRCRNKLARAVVQETCSFAISDALELYDCGQIIERMEHKGYRAHTVYIGHETEDA